MMNRRVVVTGLGMVSPIGNDVASSWQAALEGKSGIDRITAFDASAFGCQIAGEVKDFDAGKYLGVKEVRRFDRFVHFGVSAGIMALEDSGLEIGPARDHEEPQGPEHRPRDRLLDGPSRHRRGHAHHRPRRRDRDGGGRLRVHDSSRGRRRLRQHACALPSQRRSEDRLPSLRQGPRRLRDGRRRRRPRSRGA